MELVQPIRDKKKIRDAKGLKGIAENRKEQKSSGDFFCVRIHHSCSFAMIRAMRV